MIDRRCISWSRIVAAALAAAALSSCGSDSDSGSAAAPQKDSGRIPIIVSSFEALSGRPQNNTELVAQVLPEHMPSFEIIPCPSLPMVYETAPERLVRCFEANPDAKAVLSLGEGENQLELEQFTSNLDDDATADNKGEVRRKKTIVAGGERYIRLSLPGEELFKASTPTGSPIKLAYDKDKGRMGNFVGNHVAYTFAHYLVEKKSKVPYGFITVPNAMSPEAGHNPYEIARAIGHILEQGLKPALVVAAAQFPADVGDVISTDDKDGKDGKDSKEEPAQNGKDDQDQDQGKDGKDSDQDQDQGKDGKNSSQDDQGQKDDGKQEPAQDDKDGKNSSQTDQGQKDDGKQEPAQNDKGQTDQGQKDDGKQEPAKNDKGQTDQGQKDDGKQEPAKDDSQQNSGKQEPAKNDKGQQDSGKQEPAQDKDSGKQEPAQDDKGQQGKQQDQQQQKGQEKSEEPKKETASA